MRRQWISLILTLIGTPQAMGWELVSPSTQVPLVELYTSEGCSSCPPAEQWLGALRGDSELWRGFVPVSFHVDYWNEAWKDRFSRPAYSARQRTYSIAWGNGGSVYTPGFAVSGHEWRRWGSRSQIQSTGQKVGVLKVTRAKKAFIVTFSPEIAAQNWTVTAAVLGNGIVSYVGGGENDGRAIQHDFVVLDEKESPLAKSPSGWSASVPLAAPEGMARDHLSVAVWVTRDGEPTPVQAVGGDWKE